MEINQGNVSTIATMVWGAIISPILVSYGISIDNGVGTAIVSGIILLILLIWSAFNPNGMKIFGNDPTPTNINTEETVLNDEYECDEDGC